MVYQHQVIISLAANCDHEKNLSEARHRLEQILSSCNYTRKLWTDPISTSTYKNSESNKFKDTNTEKTDNLKNQKYLNQLVYAHTALTIESLTDALKIIEVDMGRTHEDRQRGIVRIDLDLLEYDRHRYHLRDWNRPYIKQLLLPQP